MHPIELLDNKSEVLTYNVSDFPIKLGNSNGKDSPIRCFVNHWHNDLEFTAITDGAMHYCVNGTQIALKEGEMLFINSARMHYNYWEEQEDGEFLCTIFHPSLLDAQRVNPYLERLIGINAPAYLHLHPDILREKKIITLVQKLHTAAQEQADGCPLALMAYTYEIALALLQYGDLPVDIPSDSKKLDAMHRMTGFVQQKYAEKLSLADIAAAGFVSRTVCCELFRRYAGRTPMEYLTEYRISKSTDLLKDGTMSMTEISALCGFGSPSYFTETFRKVMGCTPTEFRRK